jgi:16S rRNA (adenine1518-N6/adenine1519-N6)-dimethyltransferase
LFTGFCEQIVKLLSGDAAIGALTMKLSDISATLREIGVSPVRSLGQNFLHDQNVALWIVSQAELTKEDYVVEIGPGLGALTELALAKGARVLAIEKDGRLAKFLRSKFGGKRLEVVHGDALDFDIRTLFAQPRVKVLGNLPYYISSQLVTKYVTYPSPISLWMFMLQKEMAQRISAEPSTKDYGALTLQVQLHHRVKYLRTIRASVFLPQPEVDSAVLRITSRDSAELAACEDGLFTALVRRGFSQRRKQLGKLLREQVDDWSKAARSLGLNPQTRAETLSLRQWIALANYLHPMEVPERRVNDAECFPVVDKNDRLLHEAPRAEVHGDNFRHRAVHILIFNDAGEVYLQKRSRWKDRNPLLWDSSAAGHVTDQEEYDESARRELQEELGVDVPLERILKLPASVRTGQEFIWLYRGHIRGEVKPSRSEIEAGIFCPVSIVDGWITARPDEFAPAFVECWRAYRGQKMASGAAF